MTLRLDPSPLFRPMILAMTLGEEPAVLPPPQLARQRHYLRNEHGWLITYVVNDASVLVIRSWRGEPAGQIEMTRDEARRHYALSVLAGFETLGGDL